MKSQRYLCPGCDKPLIVAAVGLAELHLYCAHGPCVSDAANRGAEGETEAEAYRDLVAAYETEQEQIKGGPPRRRRL